MISFENHETTFPHSGKGGMEHTVSDFLSDEVDLSVVVGQDMTIVVVSEEDVSGIVPPALSAVIRFYTIVPPADANHLDKYSRGMVFGLGSSNVGFTVSELGNIECGLQREPLLLTDPSLVCALVENEYVSLRVNCV